MLFFFLPVMSKEKKKKTTLTVMETLQKDFSVTVSQY